MFKKLICWAWAGLQLSLHKFLLSSRITKAQDPRISNFECLTNPALFSSWAWTLESRAKHELGTNFDLFKQRASGMPDETLFIAHWSSLNLTKRKLCQKSLKKPPSQVIRDKIVTPTTTIQIKKKSTSEFFCMLSHAWWFYVWRREKESLLNSFFSNFN